MMIRTSAGLKFCASKPWKITRRRRLKRKKVSATRSSSRRLKVRRELLVIKPFQRLKSLPGRRGEGELRRLIKHRQSLLPLATQIIGAGQALHRSLMVGENLQHTQEALLRFRVFLFGGVSKALQNVGRGVGGILPNQAKGGGHHLIVLAQEIRTQRELVLVDF